MEESLLRSAVRQSAQAAADLLAAEFIEFGSSGRIFNKQQTIESLQNEPVESLTQNLITEFTTSILAPGVILATYQLIRQDLTGEPFVQSLRSSIWKSIDDQWQMVFHQGTLVKKSSGTDVSRL